MNRKQDFLKVVVIIAATPATSGDREFIIHALQDIQNDSVMPDSRQVIDIVTKNLAALGKLPAMQAFAGGYWITRRALIRPPFVRFADISPAGGIFPSRSISCSLVFFFSVLGFIYSLKGLSQNWMRNIYSSEMSELP